MEFWQKHSLSIVLAVLLVILFIASWPLGKALWSTDTVPYWKYWLAEVVLTIKTHVLVMLGFVILTKYFREYGSKEG